MTNVLTIRIVLLTCISIGGLTSIIATAGKEWEKLETGIGTSMKKKTYGLWYFCLNSKCRPTTELYENSESLTGISLHLYHYWSK